MLKRVVCTIFALALLVAVAIPNAASTTITPTPAVLAGDDPGGHSGSG
jgi:hypothetical protein